MEGEFLGAPSSQKMGNEQSWVQTYPAVHRLEAEVGGHLHVGAAQGEDAQAEIQQLQRQQGDPGVALLGGTGIGSQSQRWVTSAGDSHFTQSPSLVLTESKPLKSLKFNPNLPSCWPKE